MDETIAPSQIRRRGLPRRPLQRTIRHGALLMGLAVTTHMADAIDLPDVLYGISVVESGRKDIGVHHDGITYGRYGVTHMAVRELQRLGRLGKDRIDLRNPASNKMVAAMYLTYLKERYGSWWHAVRRYNPRSKTYAAKVWAAMDRRRDPDGDN